MEPSQPTDSEFVARWLELVRSGRPASLDQFCSQVQSADRGRVREACTAAQAALELLRQVAGGDAPELPSGSRLDEFELLEPIGRGGMGVVYRARQASLERDVAIKVLRAGARPTPSQLARFRTEALATARVDDPRIVKVHGVGEVDGLCFLVMELVDGHSLHQELSLLRDATATATLPRPDSDSGCRRLAGFFAEIAEALDRVHLQGVLHRDIQPKNILIDRLGRPRVIDFGLARIVDQPGQTNSGEVVGTPCYMSPEQVRAERIEIDRRTDVYSLAVVLYEALVGERAFVGSSTEQVLARIMRVDPPSADRRNRHVPRELAIVCQKAMQKDLARRYGSAAEFASDLRRCAVGEPIVARAEPRWRRFGREVARRRAPWLLAALVAILGVPAGMLIAARQSTASVLVDDVGLAGAAVLCQRFDELTWQPTTTERLGTAPVSAELPLGQYRIWLVRGEAFAECQLSLITAGHRYAVGAPRLASVDEVRQGMAEIAAASFLYGNDHQRYFGHGPQDATVDDYLIDEAEVTNREFRDFVLATGIEDHSLWPDDWRLNWDPAWDDLPVAGVDYAKASAFAAWAGKRLPSSRERMYAAIGSERRRLPWRSAFDRAEALAFTTMGRAPSASGGWQDRWKVYLQAVVPVRSMPQGCSPFGLFHTLGNVTEWTESLYCKQVDGRILPSATERMVAEPTWDHTEDEFLTARHIGVAWDETNFETLGFRCAKSRRPPSID